jgi:hypothetical protein
MKRLLLVILLTGCATTKQPAPERDTAPVVSSCLQHRTAMLNPSPVFFWQLPDYLAEVIYTLAEERQLRAAERKCIEEMKAKGVIR